MNNNSSKTRLEEIKEGLYRRDISNAPQSKFRMKSNNSSYNKDWEDPLDDEMTKTHAKKRFSVFEKMLAASILFFVSAAAVAAILFFSGGNVVSSENVKIGVFGPIGVPAGEELSLQVAITNDNNAKIELTDLLIEYPDGTRRTENTKEKLMRERVSLGVIQSGETINHIIRSALYGEEGESKKILVVLEYRVEGSNAIFTKESEYEVTITSSSVNLTVNMLEEISANQEMSMEIVVKSNSETPIEDLLLRVYYPFGFESDDFNPEPLYGNSIWKVKNLSPGKEAVILISGIMRGQDNEEKIFRVEVGKQDDIQEREIGVAYSSVFREVTIKKPFLGAALSLNDSPLDKYVTGGNETIKGKIVWTNNLLSKIADAVIEVKFEGEVLDKFSVYVEGGNYNSSSNTIIWDKRSLEELGSIEAGKGGTTNFSFKAKSLLSPDAIDLRNPEIKISVSISGARVSEDGAIEGIKEFIQKNILINSSLQLTPRIVYYAGPFENTGPLPPKSEQQTTYTVMLSAINSTNEMSNVKVRAVLPSYVSFIDNVYPNNTDISFNSITGEAIWNLGSMDAGEGVTSKAHEAAFQISLLPSVSHIGSAPELIYDIEISGRDNFTGSDIVYKRGSMNTNLSTDPQFKSSDAQVIQ